MESLNKLIKSVMITFVIMTLGIIIPNTATFAASSTVTCDQIKQGTNVGKNVVLSLDDLHKRSDLYCIQWKSSLHFDQVKYVVNKYVKIEGNTATDNNGNKSQTTSNGKLAYIIAKGDEYFNARGGKDGESGVSIYPSQQAVWGIINYWYQESGKKLGNFDQTWEGNNSWGLNQGEIGDEGAKLSVDADTYAKNIGKISSDTKVENKTNKNKITVKSTTVGNKQYTRVGPFKYKFSGKIESLSVKDQNGKNISNVKYGITQGKQQKFVNVSGIKSNKNFYIYLEPGDNVSKITGLTGKVSIPESVYNAELWFLTCNEHQNLLLVKPGTGKQETNLNFNDKYDTPVFVDLQIKKVDEDNTNIPLKDVEFVIYNRDLNKYVKKGKDAATYVSKREDATVYKTGSDGKFKVKNIVTGNYYAYEIANPNEGYVIKKEPVSLKVGAEAGRERIIKNKFEYIKLSGYVWVDKPNGVKQSIRNDLYRDGNDDTEDIRKSGVTVRLRDSKGNILQETKTDQNGEYKFENVDVDTVDTDYVEFIYDGLLYQNVITNFNKDNGSKAAEGILRDQFNGKFARVDAKAQDEVQIKDDNGNNVYNVKYTLDSENRTASIKETNCLIAANTKLAGYTFKYNKNSDTKEIKNINLGLYEREQTDLALTQDLEQVKISVKGDTHIYKYASRFTGGTPTADDWNVGVKFPKNRNNATYLRPVYRADAEYEDRENANNNIKMYLTYKLAVGNQSSIFARVNGLSDYFDSRYEFVGAGLGLDDKGNITNSLDAKVSNQKIANAYYKVDIGTNSAVKPNQDPQYVYVQFELSRENILNLLNEAKQANNNIEPNLKNIAEINSYTLFTDESMNKYYAAVDNDSVVGNIDVNNENTYEDDTRTAPNVGLVIANARQISGVVFEDEADQNLLKDQNIRQGDGKFDSTKESTVGGVTVQLMEVDSNGKITDKVAQVYDETLNNGQGGWTEAKFDGKTGDDGKYSFKGFAPGSYAIKYTWGNGMYKIVDGNKQNYDNAVENYKATIFEKSRYDQENSDPYFYNKLNGQALTHGTDDWELRKQIDSQLNSHPGGENNGYNFDTKVTVTEMISKTPIMKFKIEYDDNDLNNITEDATKQVTFNVDNIDFGIVRRPIQSISIDKKISHVTLRYTSGDLLIDADVDNNGKLTGQTNYLTYMKPTVSSNGVRQRGFLKAEIDSEVLQNTSLNLKYNFEVKNSGEADYNSEGFYNFGIGYYESLSNGNVQKNKDIVTISPTKMIDYLDRKLNYTQSDEENTRYGWTLIDTNKIKEEKYVSDDVVNAIDESKTYEYYTDCMASKELKPQRMVDGKLQSADSESMRMVTERSLSPSEDVNMLNQIEIVEMKKSFGSRITCIPGNYKPFGDAHESDDSMSEEMIVTPSTGGNKNYAIIGSVTLTALVVLGLGVYFIRRMNNKEEQ